MRIRTPRLSAARETWGTLGDIGRDITSPRMRKQGVRLTRSLGPPSFLQCHPKSPTSPNVTHRTVSHRNLLTRRKLYGTIIQSVSVGALPQSLRSKRKPGPRERAFSFASRVISCRLRQVSLSLSSLRNRYDEAKLQCPLTSSTTICARTASAPDSPRMNWRTCSGLAAAPRCRATRETADSRASTRLLRMEQLSECPLSNSLRAASGRREYRSDAARHSFAGASR